MAMISVLAETLPQTSTIVPLCVSLLAVCVSILSFCVAILSYRRKSGLLVRGVFTFTSSRACNDKYVSEVILENLKDRAITIFVIYLRIGHNNYIEIEDMEQKPLVLRPFETYRKEFGPIEFYGVNDSRISLNHLLTNRAINKQLILSTSDGKYEVPSRIHRWSPIEDYFRNHLTAVITPIRSTYKGNDIGSNVAYVVEFVNEDEKEEIVQLDRSDYEHKIFKDFVLTKESLASKEALEEFLKSQIEKGKLLCKRFGVYDLEAWRKRAHEFYSGKTIQAHSYGCVQYHIMGRAWTRYSNWRLKREDRSTRRVQQIVDKGADS